VVADRGLRLVVVGAVLALAACGGTERRAITNGKVEVDGRTLAVHCSGSGSPTVVLEAGLGSSSATWAGIRPSLAKRARVCAYDRLGDGESDAVPDDKIQTVDDQTKTLAGVLDAAGVGAPYVLVGHSWGGAIVQRFVSEHRSDVAGIVLDDSSTGDATRRWLAMLPSPPKSGFDPFREVRNALHNTNDPMANPERVDWPASVPALHSVKSFGSIPLVVLTAGTSDLAAALQPPYKARAYRIWLDAHSQLAALSSDSVHAIAEYSGHFIHEDQPDVVVAAVRAVVRAAREDERLPPCRTLFRGVDAVRCL
jgi:pimeloyl-ACP methyl ester carboxylesterase